MVEKQSQNEQLSHHERVTKVWKMLERVTRLESRLSGYDQSGQVFAYDQKRISYAFMREDINIVRNPSRYKSAKSSFKSVAAITVAEDLGENKEKRTHYIIKHDGEEARSGYLETIIDYSQDISEKYGAPLAYPILDLQQPTTYYEGLLKTSDSVQKNSINNPDVVVKPLDNEHLTYMENVANALDYCMDLMTEGMGT